MTRPAKLVVGSTFSVAAPRGGGPLRIFHLYREIARRVPVDVVALVDSGQPAAARELAPGLREIRVPKTTAHADAEGRLHAEAGVPVTDIAFTELHRLTPGFGEAVARAAAPGAVMVASHPYALPAMRSAAPRAAWWYDAHNVEADLKRVILPASRAGRRLLAQVQDVEREACRRADRVLAACEEDAQRLSASYGVASEKLLVVPNGVDTAAITFTAPSERRAARRRLRLPAPLALFIGSWHEPNVVAARHILTLAMLVPAVTFAIVGSVGIPIAAEPRPANVQLFGEVSDGLKRALLGVSEVALNPMLHGGGTNMKMLDYLAAGLPVVTTPVGVRGLGLDPGSDVRVVAVERFPDAIGDVLDRDPGRADAAARAVREAIVARFDWAAVAAPVMETLGMNAQSSLARSATSA